MGPARSTQCHTVEYTAASLYWLAVFLWHAIKFLMQCIRLAVYFSLTIQRVLNASGKTRPDPTPVRTSASFWGNLVRHARQVGLDPQYFVYFPRATPAKEISKPPVFWLLKSSGHQSLPCLFDSRFLWMFRTTPIFGMSRDHNKKRLKIRTEWIIFEILQYVLPKHGIIYNS